MGFGFAASFIIFIALAIGLAWYTKNPWNGIVLIGLYAIIKVIWNVLTK